MIILDTNVLSEMLTPSPSPAVESWLAVQPPTSIFITTVTKAELLYGVAILPEGRRKSALHTAIKSIFSEEFSGRILPFDDDASEHYANIASHRRSIGKPISQFDAQIAAIAASRGAKLSTRNVSDFEETGVDIVNPWATRLSR